MLLSLGDRQEAEKTGDGNGAPPPPVLPLAAARAWPAAAAAGSTGASGVEAGVLALAGGAGGKLEEGEGSTLAAAARLGWGIERGEVGSSWVACRAAVEGGC